MMRSLILAAAVFGAAATNHHNPKNAVHTSAHRTKTVQLCIGDIGFNVRQPEIEGDNLGAASFNAGVFDCATKTVSSRCRPKTRTEGYNKNV